MGQQQLLLIILGVIVVGIAIAVGISMFSASSVQSNKDSLVNDMNNLAADAYQFRIRPSTIAGGGGSYTGGNGYSIPSKLASNENGTYTHTNVAQAVTFVGTSSEGYGTITAVCDSAGRLGNFTYTGQFQ
jgi:hypothetical protein